MSRFSFEPAMIDTPPNIGSINIEYPDAARKNGVEGKVTVRMTLGEDGRFRDVVIVDDLPFGVGAAVRSAFDNSRYTPATLNGKPVAMQATFTYEITAVYSEYDSDVSKPKLIGKPVAAYPQQYRGEARKGKVNVAVLFYTDGRTKALKAESTMPPEFDEAAKNAVADLKFQPAVHKKSKKPINLTMWVAFEFKP